MDSSTVDRIVAGVLKQLGEGTAARSREKGPNASAGCSVNIPEHVVTAELLRDRLHGEAAVIVGPRAIVTPAAWDVVKEAGVAVRRAAILASGDKQITPSPQGANVSESSLLKGNATSRLLIVVSSTEAVERVWDDLKESGKWRRELLGCADDAATLAIGEVSRGGASHVIIAAEQSHRAACLANRNEKVKAVAVDDVIAVKSVKKQLRANVWCIDPGDKSWFELRNLVKAIAY